LARPLLPIDECLAGELYNHFLDFIDRKQAIPLERAFWRWLIRRQKYTKDQLPEHTFRWQFGRLLREGYIGIEPDTRSLVPLKRRIVPLDRVKPLDPPDS
jgi:hypothetical protein